MQKKITHQEADLYYEDSGAGEAVLLLHGFAEDHEIWKEVLAAFPGFRLILPDLPGSGRSSLPDQLSIDSMADAVAAIMQVEKIQQAIVIGHSMGGYVTLALADKHPEFIRAFGLFHSTAFADGEEKKNTRRKNIRFIEAHGSREFLKQSMPGLFGEDFKKNHTDVIEELIEKYSKLNPAALAAYQQAMIDRPDRTAVLLNSSKPVLFIIGKEDNAVPFDDSMKLCHLPSLSYIHVLDRAGHMGMFEASETCIEILKNFLKDLTVSTVLNG